MLSNIKLIKSLRGEHTFLTDYKKEAKKYSLSLAKYTSYVQVPTYIAETAIFGLLIAFVLSMIIFNSEIENDIISDIFPMLGVFVVAVYRIRPGAQMIYQGYSSLKYARPIIEGIKKSLEPNTKKRKVSVLNQREKKRIINRIKFDKVSFGYSKNSAKIIKNLNCQIKAGQFVGCRGTTGSGKTTFMDLLIGLIKPDMGAIIVNGEDLAAVSEDIINQVSYVPQDIILRNASIIENVGFGQKLSEIDVNKVKQCLEMVDLLDFIEKSCQMD